MVASYTYQLVIYSIISMSNSKTIFPTSSVFRGDNVAIAQWQYPSFTSALPDIYALVYHPSTEGISLDVIICEKFSQ